MKKVLAAVLVVCAFGAHAAPGISDVDMETPISVLFKSNDAGPVLLGSARCAAIYSLIAGSITDSPKSQEFILEEANIFKNQVHKNMGDGTQETSTKLNDFMAGYASKYFELSKSKLGGDWLEADYKACQALLDGKK